MYEVSAKVHFECDSGETCTKWFTVKCINVSEALTSIEEMIDAYAERNVCTAVNVELHTKKTDAQT